jgi:transcriptional regulator with XRE-family HTH domain
MTTEAKMKIAELLDETKNALGISSDGELARALGIDKRRVSNYRLEERAPDEFVCLKIAEALGKPLDSIIATVKATSEKDETRRKVWENYMKRLGGIAASFVAIIFLLVTTIVTSPTAEASNHQAFKASKVGTVCIM